MSFFYFLFFLFLLLKNLQWKKIQRGLVFKARTLTHTWTRVGALEGEEGGGLEFNFSKSQDTGEEKRLPAGRRLVMTVARLTRRCRATAALRWKTKKMKNLVRTTKKKRGEDRWMKGGGGSRNNVAKNGSSHLTLCLNVLQFGFSFWGKKSFFFLFEKMLRGFFI